MADPKPKILPPAGLTRMISHYSALKQAAHADTCLCGLLHVKSACLIIAILQLLCLIHSLIFIVITIAGGQKRFESTAPQIAAWLIFHVLYPITVFQSLWIVTTVALILGVKASKAWLLLPQVIMHILSALLSAVFCVFLIVELASATPVHPPIVILLCSFIIGVILLLLYTKLIMTTHGFLKRTKVTVLKPNYLEDVVRYHS